MSYEPTSRVLLPRFSVLNVSLVAQKAEEYGSTVSLEKFLRIHKSLPGLWRQLVEADRACATMRIAAIVREILQLSKTDWRTVIQTLEKLLRSQNMQTWLIARRCGRAPLLTPSNIRIMVADIEGCPTTQQLFIACNPSYLQSIAQLLSESANYEANLQKLRYAGFCSVSKQE